MPAASFPSTSDPPETFRAALERLLEQRHTPADIQTLRRALISGQIAQATGERAVAIGGNVDDTIIVSGDNNIIATFKGPDANIIRQIFHQALAEIESDRYARSLQDYFRALRAYCASLPYLTLHDIRPPKTLDEVYVPLQAQPQPREREEKTESQGPRDRPSLGPLSIAEVLQRREHTHLLILGEPGAGKSTLLRQLAEHAWDAPHKIGLTAPHLPLLVPLRSLALTEGTLEERLKRALASEMMLLRELPAGFFDEWPRQAGARWLLLFDGLDEVSADRRAELMRWLKSSLQWLEGHRLILTTRPSGYARGELDETLFGHYEILPFTPAQTDEFARKWFQEQADAFLQELARVRAGALSGTPLLLTIAAKVYLEKQALPARRSALYDQFVDIWLREAIDHRGLKNELGERACKVARFALARLALAMTERAGEISEAELFQKAAEYLRNALHLSEDEAEVDGEKFVRVMARRSGVFLRRGEKYDWLHPTFREYLAAEAIARECRQEPECVWERAVSRWEDENWREVALFTLSVLSDAGKDITALVERIWKEDDEGLYFAGYALAEQVRIQDALAQQIITALLDRARRMSGIVVLFGDDPITVLGELRGYPKVAEGLLALAQDAQVEARLRERAAEALGKLERVEQAAEILLLLSLLLLNQVARVGTRGASSRDSAGAGAG